MVARSRLEDEERRSRRYRRIAEQIRDRMRMIGWWRKVMHAYPCGLVPVATAARILHVSPLRVRQLIKEKRVPVVRMPGGSTQDTFIPIDALLCTPTPLEAGRPLKMQKGEWWRESPATLPNMWAEPRDPAPDVADFTDHVPEYRGFPKSLPDKGL